MASWLGFDRNKFLEARLDESTIDSALHGNAQASASGREQRRLGRYLSGQHLDWLVGSGARLQVNQQQSTTGCIAQAQLLPRQSDRFAQAIALRQLGRQTKIEIDLPAEFRERDRCRLAECAGCSERRSAFARGRAAKRAAVLAAPGRAPGAVPPSLLLLGGAGAEPLPRRKPNSSRAQAALDALPRPKPSSLPAVCRPVDNVQ